MKAPILRDEKERLVATRGITLNGKPAVISGTSYQFALVRSLDCTMQAEWSWDAVRRIVDTKQGKFKL